MTAVVWLSTLAIGAAYTHREVLSAQSSLWAGKPVTDDSARNVSVAWELDLQAKKVRFSVSAQAKGYVALGFSKGAGMREADIIVGWIDSEEHILDMHGPAYGNGHPILDETDNLEEKSVSFIDGILTMEFSRKLDTCDHEDSEIASLGQTRLIWAFSDEMPAVNGGRAKMQMHTMNHRGSQTVYLSAPPPKPTPGYLKRASTWDIVVDYDVPASGLHGFDTTYWGKTKKLPYYGSKRHIIHAEPLIDERNLQNVHHIILHMCDCTEKPEACEFEGAMHMGLQDPLSGCINKDTIVVWGIGGKNMDTPEEAGFPMGDLEHIFILMEIHYDNPNQIAFNDKSGFRLFYTSSKEDNRPYDAGIFSFGHTVNPRTMKIPAGKKNFAVVAHCTSECSNKIGNVTLTHALLHTHLSGRALYLRHFRDGKELPIISKEPIYDFDYQMYNPVDNREYLAGDSLVLECHYNTEHMKKDIRAGLGTSDEMCLSYLPYYPKQEIALCWDDRETVDIDPDETHYLLCGGVLTDSNRLPDFTTLTDAEKRPFCEKLAYPERVFHGVAQTSTASPESTTVQDQETAKPEDEGSSDDSNLSSNGALSHCALFVALCFV